MCVVDGVVRMKKLLFVVACLAGLSCGKAQLEFTTPGEGQSFPIEQFTSVDFNVQNNEFNGVSIEFRGVEAVNQDVQCDNTQNSPLARCYRKFQQNMSGSFSQGCDQQHPCTVIALLMKDGQLMNTRTIRFTRGGAVPQPK